MSFESGYRKALWLIVVVFGIGMTVFVIWFIVWMIVDTVKFAKQKADQLRSPEVALSAPVYTVTGGGDPLVWTEEGYPLTVGTEYAFTTSFSYTPNKTTEGNNLLTLTVCFGEIDGIEVRMEQATTSDYAFFESGKMQDLKMDFVIPRNIETVSAQFTVIFTPKSEGALRFDLGFGCNEMALGGEPTAFVGFLVGGAA